MNPDINLKILLVGDPHGKTDAYKALVNKPEYDLTISLGDNGFAEAYKELKNLDASKHKLLQGNHDAYNMHIDNLLGDYGTVADIGIFFVRGAESIDRHHRTEGVDWFREEELSYKQQLECFDLYCSLKPEIVISHDCPQIIRERFFGIYNKSSTSNLLQELFDAHKPKMWLFGHHHIGVKKEFQGTFFICLEELETYLLQI